jgi:hypothetical protein
MNMVVESINSKKLKVCYIESCNNNHFGRGYCQKHYYRWKRNGDPLKLKYPDPVDPDPLARSCTIDGCNRKHKGLGYCRKHYNRLKKLEALF